MQQTPSECLEADENSRTLWSEEVLDKIYCGVSFCYGGDMSQAQLTSNIHGHLFDLSTVELFDLSHHADIILSDEVNGHSLSAETTSTTDSVNVIFSVCGKVIVDDERDLLHVDTTSQEVGSDKYTGRAGAEFLHDYVTLSLLHVAVHGRHGEVAS